MKIGILFGGRSYEHDISVITAVQVAAALKGEHEIYPIYAVNGEFFLIKGEIRIEDFAKNRVKKQKMVFDRYRDHGVLRTFWKKIAIDCIVLCCHGGEGEDGRFSALMEIF